MIKALVSDALGMPAIYDEIGIPGPWMDELKRLWLKGHSDLRLPGYPEIGRLLARLRENPSLDEAGRWQLGNIPKAFGTESRSDTPYALHELFLIKEFLFHYGKLQLWSRREALTDKPLPELDSVFKVLDPEGSATPVFRLGPAFGATLARIASQRLELEARLEGARQDHFSHAAAKLRIKALDSEFIVPRSDRELCSRLSRGADFVLVSESVANLRFRLADDAATLRLLKRLERLERRRHHAEERVLKRLSRFLSARMPLIRKAFKALEHFSLAFMLADFGWRHDGVVPKLGGKSVRIKGAVNLPLKLHLEAQGRAYQAIDLDFEPRGNLITGPNMGGKSCALQTLGQLVRISQLRVPLPCREASLPRIDNIWLNQDDSSRGADLSAFGREVVSFTEALRMPGKSLLLLDEFARGTNPAEGEALLCAILRYLKTTGHLVVAATHFSAPALMKELAQYTIVGPKLAEQDASSGPPDSPEQRLKQLSRQMDYRLKRLARGKVPPHSAIRIATILGLPEAILRFIPEGSKP